MKTKNLFYFFGIAGLLLTSCDYVKQPYENLVVTGVNNGTEISSDSAEILLRKVLLEDYTGHKCGNCPKAVDTINSIDAVYGNQVIPISIHSGYWATWNVSPYNYNWVVESPTKPGFCALDEFFQVSDQGNPNGMINRKDYDIVNFLHVKGIDVWKSEAASILANPSDVKIFITNKYDPSTKNLQTIAKVTFLNSLSGNYKLGTMIIEDSIVKIQKDYRYNPDDILTYVHRHVLRGYLFGAFGEAIGNTNPAANDTLSKVYTATLNGTDWDEDHVAVVIYIYDAATYEIIQAEELKIKP